MTFTVAEKSVVTASVPFRTKAGTFAVVYMVVPFLICVAISSPTGTTIVAFPLGRYKKYAPTEIASSSTTPTATNLTNLFAFMLCASFRCFQQGRRIGTRSPEPLAGRIGSPPQRRSHPLYKCNAVVMFLLIGWAADLPADLFQVACLSFCVLY